MSFTHIKSDVNTTDRLVEVLEIATRLIARHGFEKASIRTIAREANMSQAGLYHYFSSKEYLLYMIQKYTFTTLRNALAARLDPDSSPKERLEMAIRNHLDFFITHMDALRVCAFEYYKLTGEHFEEVNTIREDYFRIVHSVVKEVLEEQADAPSAAPLNSKRATLYIFGSLNWIHLWFDTERPTNVDSMVEELTGLMLSGLTHHKEAYHKEA